MDNHNPIRVLHIFTILNRGGAESMIKQYMYVNTNTMDCHLIVSEIED